MKQIKFNIFNLTVLNEEDTPRYFTFIPTIQIVWDSNTFAVYISWLAWALVFMSIDRDLNHD